MQGSNFSREVGNPEQEAGRPPRAGTTDSAPAGDPLTPALLHLQAGLRELQAAQEEIARQREQFDDIRVEIACRDVTDRKRLQAEVIAISEMERGRIGRDLHDVLGQNLTGIAFLGKLLERKLQERGLPEAAEAREICNLASEGMRQTRALARGLYPMQVRADELVSSLKALALDTQHTFQLTCRLESSGKQDPGVDAEAATHLYHIAQEAITNAIKHGKARNVQLRLQDHSGSLRLSIQDDGVGFNATDKPHGIGLRIMGHRASVLGGTLAVESQPARGTTVTCTLPTGRQTGRGSQPGGNEGTDPGKE